MGVKLTKLELFREKNFVSRDSSRPSIEGNIGCLDDNQASMVLSYMDRALTLIEFVSPIKDPYFTNDKVRYALFSDGTYVWDGIILNWVSKYRVKLPTEFLQHVEKNFNNVDSALALDESALLEASKTARILFVD
jgi:hypothetical protein